MSDRFALVSRGEALPATAAARRSTGLTLIDKLGAYQKLQVMESVRLGEGGGR